MAACVVCRKNVSYKLQNVLCYRPTACPSVCPSALYILHSYRISM